MKYTWKTELPSLVCVAAMLFMLALSWSTAPDRIPVHWNLRGNADGWGNRFEGLALLPIMAVLIYLLFRFLPAIDPRRSNYAAFRMAYDVIRHGTLVVIAVIHGMTIAIVRGANVDMAIVVPVLVGLFFVLIGAVMPTLRPNWFFGIRTPWTLSSDVAWTRAHRIAGWTFMAVGIAIVAAGWLRTTESVIAVVSILLAGLGVSVWVSYVAWRDDPARQRPAPDAGPRLPPQ